jgi:hypothetical protein
MHNRSLDFRFDDRFGSKSHGPELAFSFLFQETSKERPGGRGTFFSLFLAALVFVA